MQVHIDDVDRTKVKMTDAMRVGDAYLRATEESISVELSNGVRLRIHSSDDIDRIAEGATGNRWDCTAGVLAWIFPDDSIIDTAGDGAWCVR